MPVGSRSYTRSSMNEKLGKITASFNKMFPRCACLCLFLTGFITKLTPVFFYIGGLLSAIYIAFEKKYREKGLLIGGFLSLLLGIALSLAYAINYSAALTTVLNSLFGPLNFFLVGYALHSHPDRWASKGAASFAIGLSIYVGAGIAPTIFLHGFNNASRNIVDLLRSLTSDGIVYLSPTGAGVYVCLIIPFCLSYLFFGPRKNALGIILAVLGIVFVNVVLLQTQSRLILFDELAVFFAAGAWMLFRPGKRAGKRLTILAVAILAAAFIVAWLLEALGIVDIPFLRRLVQSGIESARFELWGIVFSAALSYPFGGMDLHGITSSEGTFTYAHNVWLDFYVKGGMPLALVFLLITVVFICLSAKCLRQSEKRASPLFMCLSVALLAVFVLEPVFIANFYIFCFFFYCLAFYSHEGETRTKLASKIKHRRISI